MSRSVIFQKQVGHTGVIPAIWLIAATAVKARPLGIEPHDKAMRASIAVNYPCARWLRSRRASAAPMESGAASMAMVNVARASSIDSASRSAIPPR